MWAGAYVALLLAYSGAFNVSMRMGLGKALLAGFANTVPEALAGPFVLRLVAASARRSAARVLAGGVAFAAACLLGTAILLTAIQAADTGVWRFTIEPRGAVWRVFFSLLVYGVLVAAGLALAESRRAREASARALRAETLRAESRLAILRAQLNPHFILNVLHSLVGLAERDPRAAAETLERLGATLRYALRVQSVGDDRVTLREELTFTREYLELERLRLGERLDARIDAEEAVLGRVVMPFVLQPLVENAVVHAIAPRARGGIVRAALGEEGGSLRLAVEDDGDGASGGVPAAGAGLGLRLLEDRLAALYGGAASLEIDRSPLGGRRVTVRLAAEPGGRDGGGTS